MSLPEHAMSECRCPICEARDLHDGPRAQAPQSVTGFQNINVACFVCFARFNICVVAGQVLRVEHTGEIDENTLNIFRPTHFENISGMAKLDSYTPT